ncbi:unnamed protein product, partial [Darwinula stevensoni]
PPPPPAECKAFLGELERQAVLKGSLASQLAGLQRLLRPLLGGGSTPASDLSVSCGSLTRKRPAVSETTPHKKPDRLCTPSYADALNQSCENGPLYVLRECGMLSFRPRKKRYSAVLYSRRWLLLFKDARAKKPKVAIFLEQALLIPGESLQQKVSEKKKHRVFLLSERLDNQEFQTYMLLAPSLSERNQWERKLRSICLSPDDSPSEAENIYEQFGEETLRNFMASYPDDPEQEAFYMEVEETGGRCTPEIKPFQFSPPKRNEIDSEGQQSLDGVGTPTLRKTDDARTTLRVPNSNPTFISLLKEIESSFKDRDRLPQPEEECEEEEYDTVPMPRPVESPVPAIPRKSSKASLPSNSSPNQPSIPTNHPTSSPITDTMETHPSHPEEKAPFTKSEATPMNPSPSTRHPTADAESHTPHQHPATSTPVHHSNTQSRDPPRNTPAAASLYRLHPNLPALPPTETAPSKTTISPPSNPSTPHPKDLPPPERPTKTTRTTPSSHPEEKPRAPERRESLLSSPLPRLSQHSQPETTKPPVEMQPPDLPSKVKEPAREETRKGSVRWHSCMSVSHACALSNSSQHGLLQILQVLPSPREDSYEAVLYGNRWLLLFGRAGAAKPEIAVFLPNALLLSGVSLQQVNEERKHRIFLLSEQLGSLGFNTYTFLAPTLEERERWEEKLAASCPAVPGDTENTQIAPSPGTLRATDTTRGNEKETLSLKAEETNESNLSTTEVTYDDPYEYDLSDLSPKTERKIVHGQEHQISGDHDPLNKTAGTMGSASRDLLSSKSGNTAADEDSDSDYTEPVDDRGSMESNYDDVPCPRPIRSSKPPVPPKAAKPNLSSASFQHPPSLKKAQRTNRLSANATDNPLRSDPHQPLSIHPPPHRRRRKTHTPSPSDRVPSAPSDLHTSQRKHPTLRSSKEHPSCCITPPPPVETLHPLPFPQRKRFQPRLPLQQEKLNLVFKHARPPQNFPHAIQPARCISQYALQFEPGEILIRFDSFRSGPKRSSSFRASNRTKEVFDQGEKPASPFRPLAISTPN